MGTEVKLTKACRRAQAAAQKSAPERSYACSKAFSTHTDPRLIVGYDKSDDASVYVLDENTALVQTTDFFPPIVDDPFLFGQIAAANALSDVYAMGGEPKLALNIMCLAPEHGRSGDRAGNPARRLRQGLRGRRDHHGRSHYSRGPSRSTDWRFRASCIRKRCSPTAAQSRVTCCF